MVHNGYNRTALIPADIYDMSQCFECAKSPESFAGSPAQDSWTHCYARAEDCAIEVYVPHIDPFVGRHCS